MTDIAGNSSTTSTISVGGTVTSTLETLGDHDWFRITLTAGQSITVFVDGTTLEDPYLYIRNSAGSLLYENDDINSGIDRDSRVSFTANSTGTYYIDVGAWDENYTGDYQVSVSVYTPPPVATYDQIANQLVEGYWGGDDHHFNVTQGGSITVNVTALTPAGQTLALAALQTWSDIIGVTFTPVTVGGQIVFDDNQQGAFTDGSWSGGIISSQHINISTQWLADYGTGLNSYSFQSYVHEIGHALGLGHAGNYNGSANYPYDASFQNDAWSTSIMSYFSQTENTYFAGQGFTENFVLTPMIADIIAMSTLYGLSTTTRTGNTTYGFNSNAGSAIYNASVNPGVTYTIFDSGGTDTLDYSGFGSDQLINLNAETFSNVGGEVGNVSIARGVLIENAKTSSGADTLIGNAVANLLESGGGNDTLDGGIGADTLVGGTGNDRYVVDQAGDIITELSGQGEDMAILRASYTLGAGASIEVMATVNSSATTAINLTGNEFGQSLYGNAGNNLLTGNGGSDYMVGGAGNDWYYVDVSDFIGEVLGGGDDMIVVATSYILREGNEIETLVAWNQDSFDPVNLSGNEFGQSLYGSQGANSLSGGAGNDFLVGLGGNDFLLGGAGNDNMAGGQGNDIYYVEDAGDQIVENVGEGDDIAVCFTSFALGAGQSVETLSAAEGSSAISLTGNGLAQSLYGNSGVNVLTSGGGGDYLVGGAGSDTFVLTNAPGIATIADYSAGERVDIGQYLNVAGGTDVVAGGYVRITAGGQLQVDVNGGGDAFTTIANIAGSGPVTIRYQSGGGSTELAVARQSGQSMAMAAAVAAVGMAVLPADGDKGDSPSSGETISDSAAAPSFGIGGAEPTASSDATGPLSADGLDSTAGRSMSLTSILGHDAPVIQADHGEPAPSLASLNQAGEPADAPATALAHGIVMPAAMPVAIPSAEQLAVAMSDAAEDHHAIAEVARVLLEAMAGDHSSRPIDALLDALPAAASHPTAPLEAGAIDLADHAGLANLAAFHPSFDLYALHAPILHPDAIAAA